MHEADKTQEDGGGGGGTSSKENSSTSQPVVSSGTTGAWKVQRGVLLRLLTRLKANEDLRQQDLVFTILRTFPRLLRPYLKQLAYTFDPRPSFRWLANMTIVMKTHALPLPPLHFPLPTDPFTLSPAALSAWRPAVTLFMEHLVPPSLSAPLLSHGKVPFLSMWCL